jgi:tetratricopeptide (TPR) repeat protein
VPLLESFGYHSKLKIANREFQIHTGGVNDRNQIHSDIFEEGKFISSCQIDFPFRREKDLNSKANYLKSLASKLHKEMMEEINMLFYVQSKIRVLKDYLPHFKLASVFYDRQFIPEAIESFKQCIELKNDFVPAFLRLGNCYIKQNNLKEALKIHEKGYSLEPNFPDIANNLGVTLILNHNYKSAIKILQKVIGNNPEYDEANFNLGVALFRSTMEENSVGERIVLPSRVTRFIKSLKESERYKSKKWQDIFENIETVINEGNIENILSSLQDLQINIATQQKENTLLEAFYLKFMYGGRELTNEEVESWEERIMRQMEINPNFADFWNAMGTIHMIKCRSLFLKALYEFESAVKINKNYKDAKRNLKLILNNKKGFLILLRAILK